MSNRRNQQRRRKRQRERAAAGQPDAVLPLSGPNSSGGIGGQAVVDSRTGGQDIRLMRRAVKHFPIKAIHRKLIVDSMSEIVGDSERDDRPRIAAARVMVAAEQVNVSREKESTHTTNVNVVCPLQIIEYGDCPAREVPIPKEGDA